MTKAALIGKAANAAAHTAEVAVDVARVGDAVADGVKVAGAIGDVNKLDRVGAVVAKYVRYLDDAPVFGGDRRSPVEIFRDGFRPKGGTDDLAEYVEKHVDSNFISTSTSMELAKGPYYTGGPGGFVYDIDVTSLKGKGIYVNRSLGKHANDFELEIAFPGGIPKEAIKGARKVMEDGKLGRIIENPNYKGAQ